MEPVPFSADELGDEWRRLRRTHPMMHLAGVIGITQVEAALLVGQQPGWWKDVFKLFLAYICDIPWRLRDKFHRRLATGCAGVARLRASLLDRDIPLWLNCPMKSVITQDGEVIGIEVEKDGEGNIAKTSPGGKEQKTEGPTISATNPRTGRLPK